MNWREFRADLVGMIREECVQHILPGLLRSVASVAEAAVVYLEASSEKTAADESIVPADPESPPAAPAASVTGGPNINHLLSESYMQRMARANRAAAEVSYRGRGA